MRMKTHRPETPLNWRQIEALRALADAHAVSIERSVTLLELAAVNPRLKGDAYSAAHAIGGLCARALVVKTARAPRSGGQVRTHYWLTPAGRAEAKKHAGDPPARVVKVG